MSNTFLEDIPEFLEIQRASFLRILDSGLIKALEKINPIEPTTNCNYGVLFYPKDFVLVLPEYTITEAFLQGKTYGCKIYVPITIYENTLSISTLKSHSYKADVLHETRKNLKTYKRIGLKNIKSSINDDLKNLKEKNKLFPKTHSSIIPTVLHTATPFKLSKKNKSIKESIFTGFSTKPVFDNLVLIKPKFKLYNVFYTSLIKKSRQNFLFKSKKLKNKTKVHTYVEPSKNIKLLLLKRKFTNNLALTHKIVTNFSDRKTLITKEPRTYSKSLLRHMTTFNFNLQFLLKKAFFTKQKAPTTSLVSLIEIKQTYKQKTKNLKVTLQGAQKSLKKTLSRVLSRRETENLHSTKKQREILSISKSFTKDCEVLKKYSNHNTENFKTKDYVANQWRGLQKQRVSKKEWVCVGVLPLMTPRGHFIINGSHRIIVSQMSRAPGLYYQSGEKLEATIVPSRGAWLRINTKINENGEIKMWARITPQRKMPYKIFFETYKYLEVLKTKNNFKQKNIIKLPRNTIQRISISKLQNLQWIKFLNLIYKNINNKIKHFDKHYAIGVISGQINRTLLNSTSFNLGSLGRKRLNERLGTNEKTGYITTKDIYLIKTNLLKLLHQPSNECDDDIDHLTNRRVRTCGELLQTEIEVGFARLKKSIEKQIDTLLNQNSTINLKTSTSQSNQIKGLSVIPNKKVRAIEKYPGTLIALQKNKTLIKHNDDLMSGFGMWYDNFSYNQQKLSNRVPTPISALPVIASSTATRSKKIVPHPIRKYVYSTILGVTPLAYNEKDNANNTALKKLGLRSVATQTAPGFFFSESLTPLRSIFWGRRVGVDLAYIRWSDPIFTLESCVASQYNQQNYWPLWRTKANNRKQGSKPNRQISAQICFNTNRKVPLDYSLQALKNSKPGVLNFNINSLISRTGLVNSKNNLGVRRTTHGLGPRVTSTNKTQQAPFSASKVVGTKAFAGALREFFGSNPLSQYMDQTNPLAEITHKRRLSSLGPGGIDRASAGIAVRGIHPSHYGRICPIETPEGKNAGLVNSMTMWARVNKEGFLEAPYLKVRGGSIMSQKGLVPEWQFLLTKTESSGLTNIKPLDINNKVIQKTNSTNSTIFKPIFIKQLLTGEGQTKTQVISSENKFSTDDTTPFFRNYNPKALKIVASDLKISGSSFLPDIPLPTRDGAERSFSRNKRGDINFFGVSPTQNISVATSLIPFLEHDDATRALMGSNMQRQAVPLLKPRGPIVRTGLEGKVVGESGHALQANNSGVISKSTRTLIAIDIFNTKENTLSNLTFIPLFWATSPSNKAKEINNIFTNKLNTIATFFSKSFHSTKENFLVNLFFKTGKSLLSDNNNKGIGFLQAFPKKILLSTLGAEGKSLNKQINLLQPIVVNVEKYIYPFLFSNKNKKPSLFYKPVLKKNGWRKKMQINRQREIQFLQPYTRSNQATICVQRPAVKEGDWVQKGDLIGDCSASLNGVLALGQNIVVAYLPMEGFNFEDAIVVSERLVQEELYTSIHVQRVEFDTEASVKKQIPRKIKIKKNKSAYKTFQQDWITLHNPHLLKSEKKKLNSLGIIKVGSWVGPGDVLVSKVFPVERKIAPSRHLLLAVFQEKKSKTVDTDDTSLRVPKGIHGRVINVKIVGSGTIRSFKLTNKYFRQKPFSKNNHNTFRETLNNFKQKHNSSNFNDVPVRTGTVAQTSKNYFRPCGQHKQDFRFFPEILTASQKKLQKNIVDREFSTTVWASQKNPLKTREHKIWAEGWCTRLSSFKIFTYFNNSIISSSPKAKLTEFLVTGFKVVRGISYYNNNSKQNTKYPSNFLNQNYCFDTCFTSSNYYNQDTRTKELLTIKLLEQGVLSTKLSPKLRYSLKYNLQTIKSKPLKNKTGIYDTLCISGGPINPLEYSKVTTNNFVSSINSNYREQKQTQNSQYGFVLNRHNNRNPLLKNQLSTTLFSKTKPVGNSNTQGEYKILQVRVYIAERKKLQVGDKMSGRHGNKGIVSTILPREDMPYLPDGTSIDMVLNPLGIPSRMNVGQVFECLLGLAASICGEIIGHTPFDEMYGPEASRSLVYLFLYVARLRAKADWLFQPNFPGKTVLFDGRTGTPFEQWVTVGRAYMLKLLHMVDEKIHARSIGPRSLVTQQPIKGRARGGGQRLGEMELWALEGFGAAYTLQEMLTLKSDDIRGREEVENSIITARAAICHLPETFKMMLFELKCLCLNVELNQNC